MGDVINLAERRDARRSRAAPVRVPRRAQFFFDLSSPFTYLAAERVDRAFEAVVWTPASAAALQRGTLGGDAAGLDRLRAAAEERAAMLRLPLSWPERFPAEVPAAMRVAAFASQAGRGAAFVLAATRLAFCGGFDLEDPEILAEAAAAANIVLDDCLASARDTRARRRDRGRRAAGCWPREPTGCRLCAWGARCTGGRIGCRTRRSRRAWPPRRRGKARARAGQESEPDGVDPALAVPPARPALPAGHPRRRAGGLARRGRVRRRGDPALRAGERARAGRADGRGAGADPGREPARLPARRAPARPGRALAARRARSGPGRRGLARADRHARPLPRVEDLPGVRHDPAVLRVRDLGARPVLVVVLLHRGGRRRRARLRPVPALLRHRARADARWSRTSPGSSPRRSSPIAPA